MKPIIINMNEMSDSKEIYESTPGKVGIVFLYSFFLLVVISIIWMVFGKIDEVVKSEAVIRPNSDISTIVNQTEGKITKVNVEEGSVVQKGDYLYQVDCSLQESQKEYLEEQIEDISEQKKCLEVYKDSVKSDVNLLSENDAEEQYYIQFESYFINYQNAIHSANYEEKSNQFQLKSFREQLSRKQSKLLYYKKLKNSISRGENLFSNEGEEAEYYTLYQKYISGYRQKQQQYDNQKQEINASTTSNDLVNSITYYSNQKEGLETLEKSIKSGKDCFQQESSYQLKYQEYENKIEQLQQEYQTALEDYNLNFELQEYGISESELVSSEMKMESAKQAISDYKTSFLAELKQQISEIDKTLLEYKNKKDNQLSKSTLLKNNESQRKNDLAVYTSDYNASINSTINDLKDSIATLKENIESLALKEEKVFQYDGVEDSTVSNLKFNELKSTMEAITTCETQIVKLESELEAVQLEIEHANVVAPMDGIVNSNVDLVCGDILAAGTQVMTILPNNISAYKVNIYVANNNIGKVEIGMKIKLSIDALPNSEYGYLTGTITNISQDVKVNSENTYSYYLIEATVDDSALYDKNGDSAELKSGMVGQAKIIVGEKSIFRFVMEKLNLWVSR